MKRYDYDLQSAKLLQQASRAASGWQPPTPKPRKPAAPPKPDLWWIAQAIMGAVARSAMCWSARLIFDRELAEEGGA